MDDGTAVDEDVIARCSELRQGDVVDLKRLPIMHLNAMQEVDIELGAAIITQTCDLVQPGRPNVVVAPVIELDSNRGGNAKRGSMPQFVHLAHPTIDNLFADLSHCATLTKASLTACKTIYRGVDQDDREAVGKFASRVGRRFSRFPFPDEVQPWFRPLQAEIARRHDKATPIGQLLRDVVGIRIESNGWNSPGMELTIHVIVPAGTIPNSDDFDPDDIPETLNQRLRPNGMLSATAAEIAAMLLTELPTGTHPSAPESYLLWNAFVEALADMCVTPQNAPDAVMSAVSTVTGILWTDDEFSLNLYNRTESLDLEHLSPSLPIFDNTTE